MIVANWTPMFNMTWYLMLSPVTVLSESTRPVQTLICSPPSTKPQHEKIDHGPPCCWSSYMQVNRLYVPCQPIPNFWALHPSTIHDWLAVDVWRLIGRWVIIAKHVPVHLENHPKKNCRSGDSLCSFTNHWLFSSSGTIIGNGYHWYNR